MICPLSEIPENKLVRIKYIKDSPIRLQLFEIGFSIDSKVEIIRTAPFNDPLECEIEGDYCVGLRRSEASLIMVEDGT